MKRPKDISQLEEKIGHSFRRRSLIEQALTHSSWAREQETRVTGDGARVTVHDNEELEFLGDAVLALVTSHELYLRYRDFSEGGLSKLRAHLVSARHLITAAKQLKLGDYLRLGRGEEKSGGRTKTTLQVDALEAIVAALYLDSGMKKARAFILERIVEPELARMSKQLRHGVPVTDYKSALQEAAHTSGFSHPSYVLVREEGPEHNKTFTVEARLFSGGPERMAYAGVGQGATKKKAEQSAAREALAYVRLIDERSAE